MTRAVPAALATLAIACEVFGYWGMNTAGGQRMFDEMAGMIPFFIMILGAVFALVAVATWYFARRRGASRP